ncbi:MAG: hypothetical protein ACLQU1_04430 [Bryobacteraceae bacterium]
MTVEEKIERLTDLVGSLGSSVKALTGTVETLASTTVAHDHQIEGLIQVAEKHERAWQDLQRQWQAYLNTLPRQ